MVEIKKEIFLKLIEEGFFDRPRDFADILRTLNQRGFTIKGKKGSRIGQTLTYLCRDDKLIREEIPQEEQGQRGKWTYRKFQSRNG